MPVDLSGATLADVQDSGTGQSDQPVDLSKLKPDMVNQDPNIFAALTAENARKTLTPDLGVTGDDIKGIYSKALEAANDYHRTLAQQQEQKQLELLGRAKAVESGLTGAEETAKQTAAKQAEQTQQIWQLTPQTGLGGESPLTLQKKEEAGVDIQKQTQLEQLKQGPEATATQATLQKAGGGPGVLYALPDEDRTKLANAEAAYSNLNDLQDLHQGMIDSTIGRGGILKNTLGQIISFPGLTSDKARDFKALSESSKTRIATGVFGDTAAKSAQPNVQAQIASAFPGDDDNLPQAGQKIFMLKKTLIDNLQALHNNYQGKYDTTRIDSLLANLHADFDSDAVQKYNPYSRKNQSVVEAGSGSQTANNQIAATASQGVQTNQSGSPTPSWAQGGMRTPQLGGGASTSW